MARPVTDHPSATTALSAPPAASTRTRLPSGVVTLLFTDIEGSTRLLDRLGDALRQRPRASTASSCATSSRAAAGEVVNTQGDSFFVVVSERPAAAIDAALEAQRTARPDRRGRPTCVVRVRMGIHTGRPSRCERPTTSGIDVHRAARVMGAGHGGQVLVSAATVARVPVTTCRTGRASGTSGVHHLRDLGGAGSTCSSSSMTDLAERLPAARDRRCRSSRPAHARLAVRRPRSAS